MNHMTRDGKKSIGRSAFPGGSRFVRVALALVLPALAWSGAWGQEGEPAVAVEAAKEEKKEYPLPDGLVDANFKSLTDAEGFKWDVSSRGSISRGTNYAFSEANSLYVNGQQFRSESSKMVKDATRYFLKDKLDGFSILRDVYIDKKRSGVRYLEVIRNPDAKKRDVTLVLSTNLGNQSEALISSLGKAVGEELGRRDVGFAVKSNPSDNRPGALFLLTGDRSKLRPAIQNQNDQQFKVTYQFSVPAGGQVVLMHWIAQRNIGDAAEVTKLFERFYDRRRPALAMVPEEFASELINFDSTPVSEGEGVAANRLVMREVSRVCDRYGIERGEHDVLFVSEDSQLRGRTSGGPFKVESRFGDVEFPLAAAALLQGGGGVGKNHRLFLRDGSMLGGIVLAADLAMKGDEGWSLELDPERIETLSLATGDADGRPPEGTQAYVRFHSGDSLPVALPKESVLSVVSAWGGFDLPMEKISALTYMKIPSPRHRLILSDGTTLTAFIVDQPVAFESPRFGRIEVSSGALAALASLAHGVPEEDLKADSVPDLADLPFAACLLKGNNVIAGSIANESLSLVAQSTVTELKPAEIVSIERDEDTDGPFAVFSIELAGGDVLNGRLKERFLSIKSGWRTWRVPVQHFIAARLPRTESE